MKRKILLFADWYAPGYRAGGPIRSCVNFAQSLRQDYDIYVFTSDRDLGSTAPYEGIKTDEWLDAGPGIQLFYSSPGNRGLAFVRKQIHAVAPDFIYLNSMFSLGFTLIPLWIAKGMKAARPPIVLSPRGMLRSSALKFKPFKKKIFLKAFRLLGFPALIRWHAADEEEQKDILHQFGPETSVSMIANLPAVMADHAETIGKRAGELSMIFVGRIHPIKNLDFLLEILTRMRPVIHLTVVGNLEDKAYWEGCRQLIGRLPAGIKVDYVGEIPNEQIAGLIKKHHIFVLPTQGENFGHAIFESLSSGRPVLISDQTPWRRLTEAKAGWDLSLQAPSGFEQALAQAAGWDQSVFDEWSERAFHFARVHRDNSGALEKYRILFS